MRKRAHEAEGRTHSRLCSRHPKGVTPRGRLSKRGCKGILQPHASAVRKKRSPIARRLMPKIHRGGADRVGACTVVKRTQGKKRGLLVNKGLQPRQESRCFAALGLGKLLTLGCTHCLAALTGARAWHGCRLSQECPNAKPAATINPVATNVKGRSQGDLQRRRQALEVVGRRRRQTHSSRPGLQLA